MLLKKLKFKSAILGCFVFKVGSLLAAPFPTETQNDSSHQDLLQSSVMDIPIGMNASFGIFQTQIDIENIFNVLEHLDFEQVPEASLLTQLPKKQGDTPKAKIKPQVKSSRVQIDHQPSEINQQMLAEFSALQDEILSLKKENEQLKQDGLSTRPHSNQIDFGNFANNILKDFSKEKAAQHAKVVRELEMKIETAEKEIQKRDVEIKKLHELPADADGKLIKQIEATEIKNKDIEQKYIRLESQFLQERDLFQAEVEQKKIQLAKVEAELEQLRNEKMRNQAIAEELSNQLVTTESPLNAKIEVLTQETLALKKAYQDEKQRAENAIEKLNEFQTESKIQINSLKQQNQTPNQRQAQQLLQLQQRVQLAQLNTQELKQKLQASEKKTTELEELVSKLNDQIAKNTQTYNLQLADLQQRLLNARRAEQEANRWARAAGSGNANVATNRIINLQNQIYTMQEELKTQQQSRIQLENQIQALETQKKDTQYTRSSTSLIEETVPTVKSSESPINDSSKKKLSTEAGIKGL